jgi:SAM-dependent methyltransferase
MLRSDGGCAYPVVDGIPILLVPEQLFAPDRAQEAEMSHPRYAEAYGAMDHYDAVASRHAHDVSKAPAMARSLVRTARATRGQQASFPDPPRLWLDAVYDCTAQWDAYRHIAATRHGRVLQLGGKGSHALKLLQAGASEAWLVSPMIGELVFAREAARKLGLEDRLRCVAGIAEEMPFADESFDAIYSPSSVHHMVTALAFPECRRTLRPGGRFASPEIWRAPLYGVGTKVFGKRDPGSSCQPLTQAAIAPLFAAFEEATVVHHGTLLRYPLIALRKLGLRLRLSTVWRLLRLDDAISSALFLRRFGSSVAVLATRTAPGEPAPPSGVAGTQLSGGPAR